MKEETKKAVIKALCRIDDLIMDAGIATNAVKQAKLLLRARNEIENITKVLELIG